MKRIDIIRKHQRAIEDLTEIGILDARILQFTEMYEARKQLSRQQTAEKFKCSRRTVSRYISYLDTEI